MPQGIAHSTAEPCAQPLHRKKVLRIGREAEGAILTQGNSGDEVVNMGMIAQLTRPCVKDAEHAEITPEVALLSGCVLQSPRTLGEEQIVAEPLVRAEDPAQLLWDRECDQEVADWQEPGRLFAQPLLTLSVTALVARTVATSMIGKAARAAVIAGIEAATLCRGVTAQDGIECVTVRARHPLAVFAKVGGTVTSDDVSQVHRCEGRKP
jgi:hypothetical protein